MNAGAIWWGQIGNSLRLLTEVTNSLRDCRSAVLQVPRNLPWRQAFYRAVDERRSAFSAERRLMRLRWEENADPGEFILDELCSRTVKADYWPGQSYAEYLGSRDDILLNDYHVWITGVSSKTDLAKWTEFITHYDRAAKQMDSRGVFVIEYCGEPAELPMVEKIVYTVENYDCRVFSLEAAAALENTELRNYQAELAMSICRNDPELCYELLLTGPKLLHAPVQTATEVLFDAVSSEGMPFMPMDETEIQSAAWEAAIVLLFPVLERCRMNFIDRYRSELKRYLPISNSNGDRVTDAWDLEIGALYHIVSSADHGFSGSDADNIRLCRKVRNLLAHNKIVSVEDVRKILDFT
ncbi:MAG: hypothetical protein IKY17_00250 [Oscillospiraceae bacterium]|nr:hypothetical protein [Oscillospiraceae bacterium]